MNKDAILKEVNIIFNDVLDIDDPIEINELTSAKDVKEWDSLSHIQLVVAIEKHFNIKFTASEIQSWKNIGQLCESIQKRSI